MGDTRQAARVQELGDSCILCFLSDRSQSQTGLHHWAVDSTIYLLEHRLGVIRREILRWHRTRLDNAGAGHLHSECIGVLRYIQSG